MLSAMPALIERWGELGRRLCATACL